MWEVTIIDNLLRKFNANISGIVVALDVWLLNLAGRRLPV